MIYSRNVFLSDGLGRLLELMTTFSWNQNQKCYTRIIDSDLEIKQLTLLERADTELRDQTTTLSHRPVLFGQLSQNDHPPTGEYR